MELKVACIVPTYNGRNELARLFDSLEKQTIPFDLFIVDSSSTDGTFELATSKSSNVIKICGSQFNHGGTRQLIVNQNPGYDIYVFMTQDAYLEDSQALSHISRHFEDPSVGAVCGRQLAHLDATLLAQHARLFNYPPITQIKSLTDAPTLGIKTAFMSNSFAAYRGQALIEIGGFPEHVILSEDMYATAKMLLAGYKVVYSGDAACRHSHNYTIIEEFRRYFDIGVFHAREAWIRQAFGGAGGEGFRFIKSEIKFLGLRRMHLWPSAFVRNVGKLVAYKLGQMERFLPIFLKQRIGMYRGYWRSPFAKQSAK